MDNIKVLEEIGLKKVCDETHIEQKYLKYMVDRNFEKLDHINTQGFIKILSREYKLDLSDWTEEFEEYWYEFRQEKEENGLFMVVDDKKRSKKLLIFILIVLLASTFSIFFSLFQDKVDLSNYMSNEESSYEQTSIIKEAQESLDEANSSFDNGIVVEIPLEESNSTIEEDILVDDNISEEIVEEDNNIENVVQENVEEEKQEVKEPIEKVNLRFSQEAIITPNSQLWVGIIYLDTKKRRSYLGEGNFSIDISRDQIITTGHGSFDLSIADEKKEFNKQAPIRLLVKDTNITEISFSKFEELNEGKSW